MAVSNSTCRRRKNLRRWSSNPSGKLLYERPTRGIVCGAMRSMCGADAGCSAKKIPSDTINYQADTADAASARLHRNCACTASMPRLLRPGGLFESGKAKLLTLPLHLPLPYPTLPGLIFRQKRKRAKAAGVGCGVRLAGGARSRVSSPSTPRPRARALPAARPTRPTPAQRET